MKLRKSVKNNLEYAAEFSCLDHVHIEFVKNLGMGIEAVTECSPALNRFGKLGDGLFEHRVGFLLSKNGESA